ncbi:DHA2 family efflux MFS transporter permease subunit [Mycolicibacterium fallax]|uniref:Multidrug transporter n=1 Tax=Mycolicibacterium fallax TaxID=1793 RepID=A0A1X1RG11_MYCFA|nr:DHA2 family efflux MFS transporter permease subunit [Mycolicibacterium fallax]ORV04812.1 multidrug transporter [Mycolicibacterium fallax]BBY97582.1 MFS transporter [Mycolicibacterium fallax]
MRLSAAVRPWLGLVAIALGVALIVVDTTIVNVIVPSIIADIQVNSVQAQWVQESYAIIMAALLLLVGRVADIVGARRVFLIGVLVFGASSLLAGLAGSGQVLIAARFAQGAAAAMILPTSLSLLNAAFTGKARNQAFAVWGSTIGAAAAVGPLLGGWLSEHLSWRWSFGINIPLVCIILAASLAFLDRSPRGSGRVDVFGALLSVLGLGLLAFGLIEGRTYGWWQLRAPLELGGWSWRSGLSPVPVALLIAAVALAGFAVRQWMLSTGADPQRALMNTRLYAIGSFRNGNIATLIIGVGEFGIVAVLPLWLQFTLDYTAVQAGLALVPIAVGSLVASGASFGLADKATPLVLVRIGLLLEAAGLAALALLASTSMPWWQLAAVLFVYGVGVGFATAQVTNVVLGDVPDTESGQASGIQSAFRQLGSALGIAVITTTFFSVLQSMLSRNLGPVPGSETFTRAVTDSAGAAIGGLGANPQTAFVADAARDAMTHGITVVGYFAAGILLAGLAATAFIRVGAGSPGAARSR